MLPKYNKNNNELASIKDIKEILLYIKESEKLLKSGILN